MCHPQEILKIVFISPTAESGRDGVRDYTDRLIQCLESQAEHPVRCKTIGWNDPFTSTVKEARDVIRFPSKYSESQKLPFAREFLKAFDPDWISVQWVPFGFHPKGLFLQQIHSLRRLAASVPVHLMIHEIWLGAKMESSLKERCIGALQKHLHKKLIRLLSPRCIHTQCRAYQHILKCSGISAEYLPLFGNVPVHGEPIGDRSSLRLGIFSAIHPEFEIEALIPELLVLSKRTRRKLGIFHAGRLHARGRKQFMNWRDHWGESIQFKMLGELDASALSTFLHSLDFGLSTNPLSLLDKSGTAAAMLEHGLPVINLRDDVHYRGFTPRVDDDQVLHRPTWVQLQKVLECDKPRPRHSTNLERVAHKFLTDLDSSFT